MSIDELMEDNSWEKATLFLSPSPFTPDTQDRGDAYAASGRGFSVPTSAWHNLARAQVYIVDPETKTQEAILRLYVINNTFIVTFPGIIKPWWWFQKANVSSLAKFSQGEDCYNQKGKLNSPF